MSLTVYNYITIVSVVILTILVLVQTRGASLGAGIGSGGEVNTERRGTDKTIFSAFVFAASLILGIVLPK
jgi:preprotein translocase subunit SecG